MRKIVLFLFAVAVLNAVKLVPVSPPDMSAVTYKSVTALYVATFGRAPDVTGIKYWVNDSGLSIEGIARSFFYQPETKAMYYPDNTINLNDFVDQVYLNLFNRTPNDVNQRYWVEELYYDRIHYSHFILAIINGAQYSDATILNNKTNDAYNAIKDDLDESDEPDGPSTCPMRGSGEFTVGTGRVRWDCSYYSDGRLESEVQKVDGKYHGPYRFYNQYGELVVKGDFWNNNQVGIWYFYDWHSGRHYCKEYDSDGNLIRDKYDCH